ncbi:alanine racemase [Planctomicrobium piriforme]|uniref:D-serine deaminase, pyridoxal phosphate-dependent n=1 Tax=Planctomicrobium piriforme TaxID=1576369 RepID=A0A1I3IC11_9PLAN|nr:alanine racemase [Planctomicrobium piriforme]SFI45555.1 D-serine deaminase, pyridoxal phosphate-dependent [Planctomicrobium piriforme]
MVTTFAAAAGTLPATPALVIDLPTVERNLRRLADDVRRHHLSLRPHTKTHKSRRMARLQMVAGASGLTVAKVGEAEVMADECSDILVAYPAIDPARTQRLAQLAGRCIIRVAVDSVEGVTSLATAARQTGTTIGILVDLDVGFRRTGVQSPQAALELAQIVSKLEPALRLDGIFFYPGHVWSPAAEQHEELRRIDAVLAETIDLWKQLGLSTGIVSGGSTPSAYQSDLISSQTEIRPGTYIYNDMNTVRAGFCNLEDVAAAIVCTVVSTAVPGKAVIDAGTKTLTSDRNARVPESGYGCILEYPEASLTRLSEEHGEIDLSNSPNKTHVGERVTVIPNHICPCVNLQDRVWLQHANGDLESLNVDTRGMLS